MERKWVEALVVCNGCMAKRKATCPKCHNELQVLSSGLARDNTALCPFCNRFKLIEDIVRDMELECPSCHSTQFYFEKDTTV